ncbi:hypothetical protein Tco_0194212 [Tanacetum coccineum]
MFDLEIDHIDDEYELGIGNKGHMLDDIWKNCKKVQGDNTYWWHDHGLEENERQEKGVAIEECDPPEVHVETFEVKRYSFNSGHSFICVTKEIGDTLPLEREKGSSLFSDFRGYEFAQDTLVKSSALAIIIWSIEQRSGQKNTSIGAKDAGSERGIQANEGSQG